MIKRALISVSDKAGVTEFAHELSKLGVEIISTGGTAKLLSEAGVPVKKVSEITSFPEILGGRVKTLHPLIHGGILGVRDSAEHTQEQEENNITNIDLVVINLYPFEKTVESGASFAECIEQIDIGGPAMVRSAAKNHKFVTIITDAADYERALKEMKENNGETSIELRRELAAKAYTRTATYDGAISKWFKTHI